MLTVSRGFDSSLPLARWGQAFDLRKMNGIFGGESPGCESWQYKAAIYLFFWPTPSLPSLVFSCVKFVGCSAHILIVTVHVLGAVCWIMLVFIQHSHTWVKNTKNKVHKVVAAPSRLKKRAMLRNESE